MKSPTLFIERFMVFKDGLFIYDQNFHKGVNIIRGENSTGKSTIMDLMYYALGGELKEWTAEQELCTHVQIEVLMSGRNFCLRREITPTGKSPMYFFEGNTSESLSDSVNWLQYPNQRSDSKRSYSEQMFDILGLPQHKTEFSTNLTMHQILRLIYVDQLTDTTKILKDDKEWDNAVTRKAIGEYLLSVDDLEAHKLRQQLIAANQHYESINGELKAISKVLKSEDQVFRIENLRSDIKEALAEVQKLEEERLLLRQDKLKNLDEEVRVRSNNIYNKIRYLIDEKEELAERVNSSSFEKSDTLNFISSINDRLRALEHSSITSEEFGEVAFEYCPSCLSKLKDTGEHDQCSLCKSDHTRDSRQFAYLQLINDLQFQLRESNSLIPELEHEINSANLRIPAIQEEIEQLKIEYRMLTENANANEAILYENAASIGFYRSQIESLNEKLEFAERIEDLRQKKEEANKSIAHIRDRLSTIEEMQEERRIRTYNDIEKIAKDLIVADGGYEESFKSPDEITFDFSKNKMFVNGRTKFSASSMVIMKNSIRSAIFLLSIRDPLMRYPRLMLNDNIEDKGMTPERSHNFQKNLVEICDEQTEDYQLIFTTSMIAPELDNKRYVAGPFYPKGRHTLNFARNDKQL